MLRQVTPPPHYILAMARYFPSKAHVLNCSIVGEDGRRALLFGVGANQKASSSQVVVSVAEDRQPDSQPPPSPHARCRVLSFPIHHTRVFSTDYYREIALVLMAIFFSRHPCSIGR